MFLAVIHEEKKTHGTNFSLFSRYKEWEYSV